MENDTFQFKNMNILYLIDKNQYATKLSRVRFHAITELNKHVETYIWGPKWNYYQDDKSLEYNIKKLDIEPNIIIVYKPDTIINFSSLNKLKIITYNEMWDIKYTINEINESKVNLIICHHENDMKKYLNTINIFKSIYVYAPMYHIPHCAETSIFYDRKINKEIDILLCGSIGIHYPLRQRFREVLKILQNNYICREYQHPGYIHSDSFTNVYLEDFAEHISKSKICLTCTSKYKYRLGKMVEIPMCNSVLACDIPDQDVDTFKEIMIVLDEKMSNQEIANKLSYYLDNTIELEKVRKKGFEWSKQYPQSYYVDNLLSVIKNRIENKIKLFVLGEELTSIKTKWICDVFKEEFVKNIINTKFNTKIQIVDKPEHADYIWMLAPWSHRKISKTILEKKFVITTIHHIDHDKLEENKEYYKFIDSITNRYHIICPKTEELLRFCTTKPIIQANFWINDNVFYNIENKDNLKIKYQIPANTYVVGSFQKDTEGKDENLPKYSKGPDIFLQIVLDLKQKHVNLLIILTGWRRTWLINQLVINNIDYKYFELIELDEINELYNCLDLYVVSSRVEGGPRSIIECAIAKVPIISTDVGIAELILHPESIYGFNNPLEYINAKPNVDFAFGKSSEYKISTYLEKFTSKVFYDII